MSKLNLRAMVGYANGDSAHVDPYARIQELEAQVELLSNQSPDLSAIPESDLEVLASETATILLKAAKERLRTAVEESESRLAAARAEADRILSDARNAASQLSAETTANAERATTNARSQAERIIAEAERSSEAIIAAAQEGAARLDAESLRDRQQTKAWIETAFGGAAARLKASEDQLQVLRAQIETAIDTVVQQRAEITRYRTESVDSTTVTE